MRVLRRIAALTAALAYALVVTAHAPDKSILDKKAPASFRALFHTTRGDFILEAHRSWSPQGVDRLYQLITSGYFTNNLVFRVERGYIAQFGIAETHPQKKFWYSRFLADEPPKQKHLKGTVSFGRDVKNSRSTQLFIDLADNPVLDTLTLNGVKGFTPVARITRGMSVVEKFNASYGRKPSSRQMELYRNGNAYFERLFPGLDKILWAKIL